MVEKIISLAVDETYLYAGLGNGVLLIWKKDNWELVDSINLHRDAIWDIKIDKRYVYTASADNSVGVNLKKKWNKIAELERHTDTVWALATDEKYVYSVSADKTVDIWRKGSWVCVRIIENAGGEAIAVSSDNRFLFVGYNDKTLKVYEKDKWKEIISLQGHTDGISTMIQDKEFVYTGSFDNTIRIWEKGSWKEISQLQAHKDQVNSVTVDDKYIYSASSDKTVRIWEKKTWKPIEVLSGHLEIINAITTDDFFIYSAGDDGFLHVWKKGTWKQTRVWNGDEWTDILLEESLLLKIPEKIQKSESDKSVVECQKWYEEGRKTKDLQQRREYFQQGLNLGDEYNSWVQKGLGETHYELKWYQDAIGNFEKYCLNKPEDTDSLFKLGYSYSQKEENEKAFHTYSTLLEFKPSDSTAWNNVGVACNRLNMLEQASQCFLKAIALDSKSELYIDNLISVSKQLYEKFAGRPEESNYRSLELYGLTRKVIYNPNDFKTWKKLGDFYRSRFGYQSLALYCFQRARTEGYVAHLRATDASPVPIMPPLLFASIDFKKQEDLLKGYNEESEEAGESKEEVGGKYEEEKEQESEESQNPSSASLGADFTLIEAQIDECIELLQAKKQLILSGPPGTGKTFLADLISKKLTQNHEDRQSFVQFHPEYSYENFIESLQIKSDDKLGIQLEPVPQLFRNLCQRAQEDYDSSVTDPPKHVLIIDEINRGDLSRIFGEVIVALEYRQKAIKTMYMDEKKPLIIPPNLYIIGTMNSVDRSIAFVDYAMRRRFNFYPLEPKIEILEEWLDRNAVEIKEKILSLFNRLNGPNGWIIKTWVAQPHLAENFRIGQTFFFHKTEEEMTAEWKYQIVPLLKEYMNFSRELIESFKQNFDLDDPFWEPPSQSPPK